MRCAYFVRGALAAAAVVAVLPPPGSAQAGNLRREIQESERRLRAIRAERERLQLEMGDTRVRARDLSTDLSNVERRLSASRSVLAEVEYQSDATSIQITDIQRALVRSQDQLAEGEAILNRRLRDIYKMGPLQTVQVLLGARSFTDLINRYRYLREIAVNDRALVDNVEEKEAELARQNDELQQQMAVLGSLRQERLSEVIQLQSVEREREAMLQQYRATIQTTESRLGVLETDESQLTELIAELEARRRELEAGAAIRAEDAGSLEWPLEGEIIYHFGRERQPNGTVLRWQGIGIGSPTGAPVRAVTEGTVVLAGPFQGYGPTVMLDHGGGFYTLYLYLEEIGVVQGRDVGAGQVIGTVGGADTPEGPHIEFQIRVPRDDLPPEAQDPLLWLRPRGRP